MTTPNLSEFSNLVLCLYRAAGEQPLNAFQDEALSIIKRMLPFDRSMWGTATNTPAGIDIHSIHLHNEPQEMPEFYEEVKHQDSAAAACADRRSSPGAAPAECARCASASSTRTC